MKKIIHQLFYAGLIASIVSLSGCALIFYPVLMMSSGPKSKEITEKHNFGKNSIKITKLETSGGTFFSGISLRHKLSSDPDLKLLSATNIYKRTGFLYLEKTGGLIIFYNITINDHGYLVALIDTKNPDFNFLPIIGEARIKQEINGSIPAMREILTNARIYKNEIFWNLPDAYGKNIYNDCCSIKYDRDLNVFYGKQIFIDANSGMVYPRNNYIIRYRSGKALINRSQCCTFEPEKDPNHPASEEILKQEPLKNEAPYIRDRDIALGLTPDRKGMWFANFSRNREKARVCFESFQNSAWQCIGFEINNFPHPLTTAFSPTSDDFNCAASTPNPSQYFQEPGLAQGINVIDCISDGSSERTLATWISQHVSLQEEDGEWVLKPAESTRILDQVRVRNSTK